MTQDTSSCEQESEVRLVDDPATPTGSSLLSRRGFLKLAAAGAGSAALAACAPSLPAPATRTGEKVQLVYQDWRTEWFPAMAQRMLDEFHATHPNIRVFYSPDPENVETKLLSDMQAGTAPDVFQGCSWWFPILAQKGHTLDLRPFVEAELSKDTIEDWDAAQYRAFFAADGRQYALPKYCGALALYYNKDLFDRYRVDYPDGSWSRNEYLAAMKQLTRDQNGDGNTDLWGSMIDVSWERIQMHVNGSGGNLVDPNDPSRCRMADPEAMDAFKWLHARMQEDKVMATSLDVQRIGTAEAFSSGRVAMAEDGSWALKDILSAAQFRLGVAPFPAGPIRRVTLASSDGFGIYAGTRHPEAAWELMKFLISRDYGRAMARANFLQPARVSLVDEWVGIIQEEFPEKARDANVSAFADGHIKGYSVTAETAVNMGEATRIAQEAWDRILTLGQWPVESMKDVAREIEQSQRG